MVVQCMSMFMFFFFNDTATTEIYTLSLHDALPIYLDAVAGDAAIDEGPAEDLVDHRDAVDPTEERSFQVPGHPGQPLPTQAGLRQGRAVEVLDDGAYAIAEDTPEQQDGQEAQQRGTYDHHDIRPLPGQADARRPGEGGLHPYPCEAGGVAGHRVP